jgi:hypothetical protein
MITIFNSIKTKRGYFCDTLLLYNILLYYLLTKLHKLKSELNFLFNVKFGNTKVKINKAF